MKSGVFSMPTYLDPSLKDLLCKMLTVDPKKRITIPDIKKHLCYVKFVLGTDNTLSIERDYSLTSSVERNMAQPINDFPLDEDILKSLSALGFTEELSVLQQSLSSPLYALFLSRFPFGSLIFYFCYYFGISPSTPKVFYRLLKERKERLARAAKAGKENVCVQLTLIWLLQPFKFLVSASVILEA